MAKISWGRGFFRAWVLVAVLWVMAGAVIGYGMIANPYVPPKSVNIDNAGGAVMYDTYGPPDRALRAAVDEGTAVASPLRPGFTLYTSRSLPAERLTEFLAQGRLMVDEYVAAETSARRSSAVGTVLGWTILPPLILLAFGWAVAWVLTGFRRAA